MSLRVIVVGLTLFGAAAFRKREKGKTSSIVRTHEDWGWWWGGASETSTTTSLPVGECNTACDDPLLHLPDGHCGRCRYVENTMNSGSACHDFEDVTPGWGFSQCCVAHKCPAETDRPAPKCPPAALMGHTFWALVWCMSDMQYSCYKVEVGKDIVKAPANGARNNDDCKAEMGSGTKVGSYTGYAADDGSMEFYGSTGRTKVSFPLVLDRADHLTAVMKDADDHGKSLEIRGPKACLNWANDLSEVATPEPTAPPTPEPTAEPTSKPTAEPTAEPTLEPTAEPTAEPTSEPTVEPTSEPTPEPTVEIQTAEPTAEPTSVPTEAGPPADCPQGDYKINWASFPGKGSCLVGDVATEIRCCTWLIESNDVSDGEIGEETDVDEADETPETLAPSTSLMPETDDVSTSMLPDEDEEVTGDEVQADTDGANDGTQDDGSDEESSNDDSTETSDAETQLDNELRDLHEEAQANLEAANKVLSRVTSSTPQPGPSHDTEGQDTDDLQDRIRRLQESTRESQARTSGIISDFERTLGSGWLR